MVLYIEIELGGLTNFDTLGIWLPPDYERKIGFDLSPILFKFDVSFCFKYTIASGNRF